MSLNVERDSLKGNDGDAAVHDLSGINVEKREAKPQIVIQGADLNLVMKHCNLDRTSAIALIQKCDGDIKKALKEYVLN